MRVLQLRRQLNLAPKPVSIDAGREVGREHLDDDRSTQRAILRHEDSTHAATQKLALQVVAGAERFLKMFGEVRHESVGDRTRCRITSGTASFFFLMYGDRPVFALTPPRAKGFAAARQGAVRGGARHGPPRPVPRAGGWAHFPIAPPHCTITPPIPTPPRGTLSELVSVGSPLYSPAPP